MIRILEANRISGNYPWETFIKRASHLEAANRPEEQTDVLFLWQKKDSLLTKRRIQHPNDPYRRKGQPKIHYGKIGSANTLLKDPTLRDELGKKYGVLAIEMEGSGIADGTWRSGKSYILIRGISDYCDLMKNDLWQQYAAIAAAAYARSLIELFTVQNNPLVDEAKEKLKKAEELAQSNKHEQAASICEEAAKLAVSGGDKNVAKKAYLMASRILDDYVIFHCLDEAAKKKILLKIKQQIKRLEELKNYPEEVAIAYAHLARLELNPKETLRWAEQAVELSSNNEEIRPTIRGEAFILRMQAYWQLNEIENCLNLKDEYDDFLKEADEEQLMVLKATWLRSLCKAGKGTVEEIKHFIQYIREIIIKLPTPTNRIVEIIGEVASEFNRTKQFEEAIILLEFAFEIAIDIPNAKMSVNIALQTAELSGQNKDIDRARKYFGLAALWLNKYQPEEDNRDNLRFFLRINYLLSRGRTFANCGIKKEFDHYEKIDFLHDARQSLKEAIQLLTEHRITLQGDVELALSDWVQLLSSTILYSPLSQLGAVTLIYHRNN